MTKNEQQHIKYNYKLDPQNPVDVYRKDVWASIGGVIEGGVDMTGRLANFSARVGSNVAGNIFSLFGTVGGGTIGAVRKGRAAYRKQKGTAA